MSTPVWIDHLNQARNRGERGVETVACTITNAVNATHRAILLACEEELRGFVQDLDGYQGPGRLPPTEEESFSSRAASDSEDDHRPRTAAEIAAAEKLKKQDWSEWLMDEEPPPNEPGSASTA